MSMPGMNGTFYAYGNAVILTSKSTFSGSKKPGFLLGKNRAILVAGRLSLVDCRYSQAIFRHRNENFRVSS